jgi:pimeloyl-ACP methyl ester carboxylesterase
MPVHRIDGGGNVTLAVEDRGTGRPILLVHGYSQSRMCWRHQFDSHLTDEFRLVAPDNRGHGDSDKPRDEYDDSQLWAEDIRSIVRELDLDDVVLVGWSYGGLVVLDYLEAFGTDGVAGLNFVGGVSEIGTETGTARLGSAYIDLLDGFVSTDAEESTETMHAFVDLCVEGDLSPADRYYMLGYNVVVPPHVRESLRDRTVAHDSTLEALDVPVLLTHGDEDAVMVPGTVEEYTALLEDATVSTYPDTGHTPFWERPERFNRELRAFVRDC